MVKQQTIFCQEYQRENQEVRRLPKRVFDPFGPVFVDRLVVQHSERDYYSTENGFHRIAVSEVSRLVITIPKQHASWRSISILNEVYFNFMQMLQLMV
jgi:hypothetical protein